MLVLVLLCVGSVRSTGNVSVPSVPIGPGVLTNPTYPGIPTTPDLPPPLLCPENSTYCVFETNPHDDEYFFTINGSSLRVSYREGQFLQYQCLSDGAGEWEGKGELWRHWPRPPPAAPHPTRLLLRHCPLPPRLAPVLAPLRPSVLELTLRAGDLSPPSLWEGLELQQLKLKVTSGAPPALRDLRALRGLSSLSVWSPAPPASPQLPAGLTSLRLSGRGLLPALLPPLLHTLIVTDSTLTTFPSLANLTQLRELTIDAPLTTLPVFEVQQLALSGVRNLSMSWCKSLESLRVRSPLVAPPAGWLRNCGALRELHVMCGNRGAKGKALSDALSPLPGALRQLTVTRCELRELPALLLSRSLALERLVLSHNQLSRLPQLAGLPLVALDVSTNGLTASVLCAALRPLADLRHLSADNNPLGDLCPAHSTLLATPETSCLSHLKLENVSLSSTGARHVCADWRRDMKTLTRLTLRQNNITSLQGDDLLWSRRVGGALAEVDLSGNSLSDIQLSEAQYRRGTANIPHTMLLKFNSLLECSCGTAWLSLSLIRNRLPVSFSQALKCKHPPRPLLDIPVVELECEIKDDCPEGCTCAARVTATGDTQNVTRCDGEEHDGNQTNKDQNKVTFWSWSPLLGAVMLLLAGGVAGVWVRGHDVLRATKQMLKRNAETEEQYEVDVLVVYGYWSSWAVDRAVRRMEGEWGLRGEVCLREWRGGEEEVACVARGVRRARAVLCVLAGGAVGGGGQARRVELALRVTPPERLLLVQLPPSPAPTPAPACRALLHWGAPHFWRDLRRALPRPHRRPPPRHLPDPAPLTDVYKITPQSAIKAV